jgi:hypothetical protein
MQTETRKKEVGKETMLDVRKEREGEKAKERNRGTERWRERE